MPEAMRTLAEILREQGYSTVAATGGGFVHSDLGFDQGFDEYWSFSSGTGLDREVEVTTREALAKLDRHQDRQFFMFFHTYEVHNPFRPREELERVLTGWAAEYSVDVEKRPAVADDGFLSHWRLVLSKDGKRFDDRPDDLHQRALDLYDAGIAHADRFVGQLLDRLESLGLADRTIVVITSDHGELFGEHDEVNHYTVYDENVQVPLIVSGPGTGPRLRRIASQVRSVDIMPTLLEWVGVAKEAGIDGRTLMPFVSGNAKGPDAEGRLALSYASESNHGLSVRDPSGRTLIFLNGAWHSSATRERRFVSGEAVPQSGLRAGEAVEFDRLRAVIADVMQNQLPGTRVSVRNIGSDSSLVGKVMGPMVATGSSKTGDQWSAVLRREKEGVARFDVSPRSECRWVFEGSAPGPLVIELDGTQFKVEVAPHGGFVNLWRDGTRWRLERSDVPHEGDGLVAWWQGPWNELLRSPEGLNDDVLEQLRALGYTVSVPGP
jgi:hypothetical protein